MSRHRCVIASSEKMIHGWDVYCYSCRFTASFVDWGDAIEGGNRHAFARSRDLSIVTRSDLVMFERLPDDELIAGLVTQRCESGLSRLDVASMLGIGEGAIASFERGESDPRMSTIRRYALAVGALIESWIEVAS